MRRLDKIRTSTLAVIAAMMLFVAFAVVSPELPRMTLHAQQVGPGGVPGSGGGSGAVSSVFGRTGAVVAATGDYTAAQVTNAAATNAANTFTTSQTIDGVLTSTVNRQSVTYENYGSDWFGVVDSITTTAPIMYLDVGSNGFVDQLSNVGRRCWYPNGNPQNVGDTGLTRGGPGIVDVGACGAAGDVSGTIAAANLTLGGVPITQAATAPSGSCSAVAWVLSNDGHMSYCSGSGETWVEKL